MGNNAEHQAAWRARRQQRITELEARVAALEAENERLRKALPEPEVPPADDTQRAEMVEIGQVTKQILMEALSAARPKTQRHAALAEIVQKQDFELGNAVWYMLRERPGLPISGWCTIGGYELTEEEIRNYIDSGDAGRIRRLCQVAASEWTKPAGDLRQRAGREPGWEPGRRVVGIIRGFNSTKKYFVVEDPGPLDDDDRKVKVQQHRYGDPIGDPVIVFGSQIVPGY